VNVGHIFLELNRDFFEVLIDVPAIDGFLKILIHFYNFQESMGMFRVVNSDLTHQHGHMRFKVLVFKHEVKTVQNFLQSQEDVTSQVCVPDGVLDFDDIVVGGIANQFYNTSKLVSDDREVELNEGVEQRGIFLPA
jgi:hypothetical protein